MSTYRKLPRRRKLVGPQHGLKLLTVRSLGEGCPKLLEVWVPESRWNADPREVRDAIIAATKVVHDLDQDTFTIDS